MENKLFIPKVDHYLNFLGGFRYREFGCVYTYDDRSYEILDEIFELLKKIKPTSDDGRIWSLWFKADRGPIESWSSFEEQKEWGNVKNYDEYIRLWESSYPDKENWYYFQALSESNGYRAIFLQHEHVIQVDPEIYEKSSFPYEITEFVEWLRDSIVNAIKLLEEGTYNNYVSDNLPPKYKTGTIVRKDFWDIFPEIREAHYEDISQEEINEFLRYIAEQPKEAELICNKLSAMTANDFYRFCAIGYGANNYEYCELSPKEQYKKHADGRDDGLSEIDADSTEAFFKWLNDESKHGGHPYEVCRGGNSTHISLFPCCYDDGYVLRLEGSSIARSNETIKFYNALKKEGLPVFLGKGDLLEARLLEKEKIGIVPEGVFPRYCQSYFPDEEIISFMNFPYEKEEETAAKCVWQPIEVVELVGDNNEE